MRERTGNGSFDSSTIHVPSIEAVYLLHGSCLVSCEVGLGLGSSHTCGVVQGYTLYLTPTARAPRGWMMRGDASLVRLWFVSLRRGGRGSDHEDGESGRR